MHILENKSKDMCEVNYGLVTLTLGKAPNPSVGMMMDLNTISLMNSSLFRVAQNLVYLS